MMLITFSNFFFALCLGFLLGSYLQFRRVKAALKRYVLDQSRTIEIREKDRLNPKRRAKFLDKLEGRLKNDKRLSEAERQRILNYTKILMEADDGQ